VWQSPDPILETYLDGEPAGGVYNTKNLSLYSYAHQNPVKLVDPDGLYPIPPMDGDPHPIPKSGRPSTATPGERLAVSTGLDLVPVVGEVKSGAEAYTGKDLVTGEELSTTGRVLAAFGAIPLVGKLKSLKIFSKLGDIFKGSKNADKFAKTLETIRSTGKAPDGYKGGKTFKNKEGLLPKSDSSGKSVDYKEWDVNPSGKGANRGAERIVTGSDGSAYSTKDHYKSFDKLE